jgi:hydrogenase maturation factor
MPQVVSQAREQKLQFIHAIIEFIVCLAAADVIKKPKRLITNFWCHCYSVNIPLKIAALVKNADLMTKIRAPFFTIFRHRRHQG